jgi:cytochrome P450
MSRPAHIPESLVVDFDVYDDSLADRMYDIVSELRRTRPVVYTEQNEGHWLVTRYEDCLRVLRDPTTFSSHPVTVPRSIQAAEENRPIPIGYDAPEHTRYREMITPLFAPRRMRALEERIREVTSELIDAFDDGSGSVEFVDAFARALPSYVFQLLMGWPLDDAGLFAGWSHDILHGRGETIEEGNLIRFQAMQDCYAYFAQLIAARRADPREDFTTRLAQDETLTADELHRMLMLLMLGGLHTVQGTLAYGMIWLIEHPEERRRLAADPSGIPSAVEEILRWEPPVWPARRAIRDVMFGDVLVKADDMLVAVTIGANRDGAEFPEPEDFRIDRNPNRHLTFSVGPHRCVGAHLARVELGIAFGELLRRWGDFEIDPDRAPRRYLGTVQGVETLYLKINDPAALRRPAVAV